MVRFYSQWHFPPQSSYTVNSGCPNLKDIILGSQKNRVARSAILCHNGTPMAGWRAQTSYKASQFCILSGDLDMNPDEDWVARENLTASKKIWRLLAEKCNTKTLLENRRQFWIYTQVLQFLSSVWYHFSHSYFAQNNIISRTSLRTCRFIFSVELSGSAVLQNIQDIKLNMADEAHRIDKNMHFG